MNNIDITIQKLCSTCKTEIPFRYFGNSLLTLGDHSNMELRVDPDEFLLCSTCGNPLRLRIQAQPYELVNHLDTPVARAMYEWERRQEHKSHTIVTRKTDEGQFESTVKELGVTVTAPTEHDALTEATRAIHLKMMEEYKKMKRESKEQIEGH